MIRRFLHLFVTITGIFTLLLCLTAFTRLPFDMHRWLGTHQAAYNFEPDALVMLGGSGMPAESNLIRLYYLKELARQYPAAEIYLVHVNDSLTLELMTNYLEVFNIEKNRIHSRSHGNNTREQALALAETYPQLPAKKIILITSPENMFRSVATFRKSGFSMTGGEAAFENALFVELSYNHRTIGGKKYVPDVSENLDFRYNFWNYLKLEITCFREFAAIAYYKLNGWM